MNEPVLSGLEAQGLLAHKVGPVSDGILFPCLIVPKQVMLGNLSLDLCNYEFVSPEGKIWDRIFGH